MGTVFVFGSLQKTQKEKVNKHTYNAFSTKLSSLGCFAHDK